MKSFNKEEHRVFFNIYIFKHLKFVQKMRTISKFSNLRKTLKQKCVLVSLKHIYNVLLIIFQFSYFHNLISIKYIITIFNCYNSILEVWMYIIFV